MEQSGKKYVAVGAAAATYGVIICLYWVWVLWASSSSWQMSAAEGLTFIVFASVTVMMIVTGVGLYRLQAGTRHKVRAVAVVTAILLVIKAMLALYWASQEQGWLAGAAVALLTIFVAIPSGIFALILAMTAASLGRQRNDL